MALFKIEKGLASNLSVNRPKANEGFAYFTTDDGKFYIDISGNGTQNAVLGSNRICLNAGQADKVKSSLTIKLNNGTTEGTNQFIYNGSTTKSINITANSIGAIPATGGTATGIINFNAPVYLKDNTYAEGIETTDLLVKGQARIIGDLLGNLIGNVVGNVTGNITGNAISADKVNSSLTIKLNGGAVENSNQFIYNGSSTKTINITPISINALALSGGTMTGAIIGKAVASSWLNGQKQTANAAYNICDATDSGSYWPWLRQTNTNTGKWFSIGTLANKLYVIGSSTARIENGTDCSWYFDLADNKMHGDVYGNVTGNATSASKVNSSLTIKLNGGTTENNNQFVYNGSSTKTINITPSSISAVALSGSTMTGFLTLHANPTSAMHAATKQYVDNAFAVNDALVYKGTIDGSTSSPGTYTVAANAGWTYRVSTAGYINGQVVEVGDLIICNSDNTSAATSDTYTSIALKWNIIQNNIDGALYKSANSFVDGSLIIADGTLGKTKISGTVGSATRPIYIAANGKATALSYIANRLYYSGSTSSFDATSHYASSTKIGINMTTQPSYNLQVNGTTFLNGQVQIASGLYYNSNTFGINLNNSDIINLNGLYFKDAVDAPSKGIHFYRSEGKYDTVYASYGHLYIHGNRNNTDIPSGNMLITGNANGNVGSINQPVYATGGNLVGITTIGNNYLPARLQEYHTSAINDSTISGWYYRNSDSPFLKYHSSNADFMSIINSYSSNWASEIATDFRSNRLAVRNKNNGVWNSWKEFADIKNSVYVIFGSSTDVAGEWTGSNESITELYDGLTIIYIPGVAGSSSSSHNGYSYTWLNINSLGFKKCYKDTGNLTTHYGAGQAILLVYRASFNNNNGGWQTTAQYDTINYDSLRHYYTRLSAGENGIMQYSLIMQDKTGSWQSFTTTNGAGTSKTVNTATEFNISSPIYYVSRSSNLSANNQLGNGSVYESIGLVDFRYSFNCGTTLVPYQPIFLVGTINSNGYFKLDSVPYAQTLPTTDNNKVYILLGYAYSDVNGYRGDLLSYNPIFWYKNGGLRPYTDLNGYNLTLKGITNSSPNSVSADSPKITFSNSDSSQYAALVYSDYDSYQAPDSLTLVGNQSGTYFIAPNIKATSNIYGSLIGNAQTATKLATTRTITVNLASTSEASFDGTANITPGISGILSIANGGTGGSTAATARTNLSVLGAKLANSYYGMTLPNGTDNNWIRTSTLGIIPYQSGSAGSGHGSLGTSTWYFQSAYIDTVYGSLSGNASTASKLTKLTTSDQASSTTTNRYVWFCYSDNTTGRPAYDTNFTYRSDTHTLSVPNIAGNASSASKLATARTISLTGSVTGSGTFDGSGNLSIATTTNHNHDSVYKKIQTAVSDPSASGTTITVIDTISQNTQGVISVTKKTIRDASASQSGVVSTGTQTFAGAKTFNSLTKIGRQIFVSGTTNASAQGDINIIANAFKSGYPIYTDPEFASGTNSIGVYNNSGNGTITIERIQDTTCGNSSGYVLKIKHTGSAVPGMGGFVINITSRANAQFIQIFRAKIPTGYNLSLAANSLGTGASDEWITSTNGTGKWEWYVRKIICGSTGTFSNGGHVYLTGSPAATTDAPVIWYLSYCNVIDITKSNYDGLRTRYSDSSIQFTTGRTLKVSLNSTNASTAFNGTANITDIGVSGILGTANGGTGNSSFTANTLIYANTATKLASYTSTLGSTTKGIYLNAGVPTAMTYELKSTINAGTANRLSYYSGANAVSATTGIYVSNTNLGINVNAITSPNLIYTSANTQTALSTVFNVSGGSYFTNTSVYASNIRAIEFRPNHASYSSYIYYGTAGNEALNFVNRQSVTSFIFWTGNTVEGSDKWYMNESGAARTDHPAVQIKQNSLYVNKLLSSGTNANYNFYVNGTSRFDIGSSDTSSNKRFVIGSVGSRYLSFGASGIQAYDASDAVSWLYLQYYGGNIQIGQSSSVTSAINIYGKITPGVDNIFELGTSSLKWKNIYSTAFTGNLSGNASSATKLNLYEARETTTNLNKTANYGGAGALFHLIASSSTTTGKCPTDANILQMNWDNSGGYDSQFGISTAGSRGFIRSQASTGAAWRELVTIVGNTATGSGTKGVYVSSTGQATAMTYELKATVNTATQYGVAYYSTTTNLTSTAAGATNTALMGKGSAAPAFVAVSPSQTWTNGTTAGPTLKITVLGISSTATAIPSASATISGIITTGAQTFGGNKSFNGIVSLENITDSNNSVSITSALVVKGGASIQKKLSAKEVRIDNGQSAEGVTLIYDEANDCIKFVFD